MKNTSIEKEERVIQQSIRIRVEEKMASRSRLVGCGHMCFTLKPCTPAHVLLVNVRKYWNNWAKCSLYVIYPIPFTTRWRFSYFEHTFSNYIFLHCFVVKHHPFPNNRSRLFLIYLKAYFCFPQKIFLLFVYVTNLLCIGYNQKPYKSWREEVVAIQSIYSNENQI